MCVCPKHNHHYSQLDYSGLPRMYILAWCNLGPTCRLTAVVSQFPMSQYAVLYPADKGLAMHKRETSSTQDSATYLPQTICSMSREILEQITTEKLFNTRRLDTKIFISCTKRKGNVTLVNFSLKFCTTDEDLRMKTSCIE